MSNRARQALKRKNETIAFRVTAAERERLENAAIDAGMSLSAYLAAMLERRTNQMRGRLAEMQRPPPPPESNQPALSPEALHELRRIGNNINQIAHALNSGLPPEPQHLVHQLQKLLDLIFRNNLHQARTTTQSNKAANDGSPTAQTRHEFQRRVHIRPERRGQEEDV